MEIKITLIFGIVSLFGTSNCLVQENDKENNIHEHRDNIFNSIHDLNADSAFCHGMACQRKNHFKNLIFEGGGAKALSYIGAFKAFKTLGYFENNRYSFENISGTSTGCLAALFVALDIDGDALETEIFQSNIFKEVITFNSNLLSGQDISSVNANKSWFNLFINSYNILVKIMNLFEMWSVYESPGLSTDENFIKYITTKIIPLSPYASVLTNNLTFRQLFDLTSHRLTCFASRLNTNSVVEFNVDSTPQEYVLRAVYASMTFPGVFKPISDSSGYPLVDGGFVKNFPIYMYDNDDKISTDTFGLSLNSKRPFNSPSINNFAIKTNENLQYSKLSTSQYIMYLYSIIHEREIIEYSLNKNNKYRIVFLDSPLMPYEFEQAPAIMSLAINRAYLNTIMFMRQLSEN